MLRNTWKPKSFNDLEVGDWLAQIDNELNCLRYEIKSIEKTSDAIQIHFCNGGILSIGMKSQDPDKRKIKMGRYVWLSEPSEVLDYVMSNSVVDEMVKRINKEIIKSLSLCKNNCSNIW